MAELRDGEERRVRSSSGRTYTLKLVDGAYSCSCPAWRNQSRHPHYRTCKHLIAFRGGGLEVIRIAPGDHPLNYPETRQVQAPAPGGRAMKHAISTKVLMTKKEPPPKPSAWDKLKDDDPFEES